MEIPVGEEEANSYWKLKLAETERFASTPHLLLMNGLIGLSIIALMPRSRARIAHVQL
ncbi:hypothetical protein [Paenibacillus baekrokdamisoli]|uniref:hypothetical protein n=1 Tax=Paenibacillus baekrokdamisoli TaxID=1712516 RepID=UPI001C84BEB8|nr:hypothetical protein [Paenibacillus baekrokdamisoli]